jgi:hypothetical protein
MKKREDKGYVDIGPSRTRPLLVPGVEWWDSVWDDAPDVLPPEFVSPCYVYRNGVLVRVDEPLSVSEVKKLLRTVKQEEISEGSREDIAARESILSDNSALPSPPDLED